MEAVATKKAKGEGERTTTTTTNTTRPLSKSNEENDRRLRRTFEEEIEGGSGGDCIGSKPGEIGGGTGGVTE